MFSPPKSAGPGFFGRTFPFRGGRAPAVRQAGQGARRANGEFEGAIQAIKRQRGKVEGGRWLLVDLGDLFWSDFSL